MACLPDDQLKTPLVIEQGSTWDWGVEWANEFGTPINLTGCTAKMQVRLGPGEDVLLELSTMNGRISIDEAAGKLAFSVLPSVTAALDFDFAMFDLDITFPSNKIDTILRGLVTLQREITK